ncbi:MAG TPA: hypothetical protein VKD90_07155 [Gemmataceae bacterium]|nr:hypothetical protein [Gemmataceae bacterium]
MRPFSTSRGGRRGNVTVVVIASLGLFLILGLTFAHYSIAEADQAQVFRDSANAAGAAGPDGAPPNPEMVFNQALRDIIFPAPDDITGAFNALRGHDMARGAYGYNMFDRAGNTQPFNGIGWVPPHMVHPILSPTNPAGPIPYSDRMINWTWMQSTLGQLDPRLQAMYDPDNNFFRDPRNPIPPVAPPNFRYFAKNATTPTRTRTTCSWPPSIRSPAGCWSRPTTGRGWSPTWPAAPRCRPPTRPTRWIRRSPT